MKRLVIIAGLMILGCSPEPDDKSEESLLRDSAMAPIEKTEAVEDMVLESKQKIDDALEEAED